MLTPSPFAPKIPVYGKPVAGVLLSSGTCSLKASGNPDIMIASLPQTTTVAGVFTQSSTAAAPVDWCRDILPHGSARGLAVHAGNANAFTGRQGYQMVVDTAACTAAQLQCAKEDIFVASTGVIGEQVPRDKVLGKIPELVPGLQEDGFAAAAEAIMTTDTFAKLASCTTTVAGQEVTITGIAKGSGMIMPNMATMLAFVFTDLALPSPILQRLLAATTRQSFNCITVDSDTSTNDTVLLFATGQVSPGEKIIDFADSRLRVFKKALANIMQQLALAIVSDGEGISKLIDITVTGARNSVSAHKIAMSIANSPLVKTALCGADPNWGRVVMAVGKSGELVDRDKLSIRFGQFQLAALGNPVVLNNLSDLQAYMQEPKISIAVDVGVGKGLKTVWTSDLTKQYIEINADYHT